MNPALPSHLQALAPDLARRLRALLESLRAVIAEHYRIPLLGPLVIPLSHAITRIARRLERRLARLAAGRLPWHRRAAATPRAAALRGRPPRLFPHGFGWLTRIVGYHAAGCGSQFEALLAEPAVAELLALDPALARLLHPFRRMLGIMPRRPRKPRAARPRPPAPTLPNRTTPQDWRPTIEHPECPGERPWWYPIDRERRLIRAIARLRPAPAET